MRFADTVAMIIALSSLGAAAGCATDLDEGDDLEVLDADDAEVAYGYGCYTVGAWSAAAYAGGTKAASHTGTLSNYRRQIIGFRSGHPYSIYSYTDSYTGPSSATAWQWHARCTN